MNKRSLYIISLVFFFLGISINSQNLDSLLVVAKNTNNDSLKVSLYNKIGFSYIFSDSKKALQAINKGKQIAKTKNLYVGLSELINTHGIYMDVTGQSDSAQYYFKKALNFSKEHNIQTTEVRSLNNLGMFNWNIGNMKEAQRFFFQALKMYEDLNDEKSTAIPLSNIGLIYQEVYMVEEALKYHLKSLKIRKAYNLKHEQTNSFNNIGICLKELKRYDEALKAYKDGLKVALESNNLINYYKIIENIGSLYEEQKNYIKALEYYEKAYEVPDNLSSNDNTKLIVLGKLVGVCNKLNKPKKALQFSEKAEEIFLKSPQYKSFSDDFLINSAESFFRNGNTKKARQFIEEYSKIKDSLFSANNAKALADLKVKYQTEKKEKEILLHKADLAEKELHINQKNTQIIGLGILAIVISVLGYLVYKQQKLKNEQLKKEGELKEALVKIETQNKLNEQRLKISRDLHDNIGAQLTFVISSIDNLQYGFKIKNKKLSDKLNSISAFTKDTIYELRDTIWAMNKNAISLEDLQGRISNFIDNADASSNSVSFNFTIDKSLSKELEFKSVMGMNIYRIIQEAINNAIKYSEASNVIVNIENLKDSIKFVVQDNGKGFDENKVVLGNGLNNMKKRARDINATLKIESELNKGTSIILEL
ncbi:tetratricopeptide repeat-containing sensor histidine kinase [Thalassobellus citreus]|uniref:tetratricopeptide repeat-containing sensor histidine kinase n=1 Tax=Thalassobellus citreus TaxID=3367752 RepID=UPI003797BB7B